MKTEDRQQILRITVDEVEQALPHQGSDRTLRPQTTSYGRVAQSAASRATPETGTIFFRAWFYLGSAGLLGSLAAWAIAEPGFVDGAADQWGNIWLMPMVVSLMCVGLAIAESLIERSRLKALRRAGLSLALGMVFGLLLHRVATAIYHVGLQLCGEEALKAISPSVWIARGVAWAVFGIAGGIVYGIVGQSAKKTAYGVLGRALGAALGGVIFDPISFVTHGGAPSRAVGFCLLGLSTGAAIGLVESALKNRWLYVTAGPLAGKQFILYKAETTVGSNQDCDIHLFKDADIEPDHAVLQQRASRLYLQANGPVYVSGQKVHGEQVLKNGQDVQIGRYRFCYQEKER